jgi:hypothetical protein
LNQSLPDEHDSPGQSIAKWLDAIYLNVANGFLLQDDAGELWSAANAWDFPN